MTSFYKFATFLIINKYNLKSIGIDYKKKFITNLTSEIQGCELLCNKNINRTENYTETCNLNCI
jgi:hypothetical protein